MEKEFVTYEQAVKLKELGLNEKCFGWYSDNKDFHLKQNVSIIDINQFSFLAPLKQQVFRWFREVHNCISHIEMSGDKFFWCLLWSEARQKFTAINRCVTYEEAENKCINQLISLIEAKNNAK